MKRTTAEEFDEALQTTWASHPDRLSNGRYFWEAAVETFMQQHVLIWGRELHAFEPDNMKELGRWLAKCEAGREKQKPT